MSLIEGFLASAVRVPERPALFVDGAELSYAELRAEAVAVAAAIARAGAQRPLTALLASRSRAAYAGVLGALHAGHTYVPLNPKFPVQRLQRMWKLSGAEVLVVGEEAADGLRALLKEGAAPALVVVLEEAFAEALREEFPAQRFVARDLAQAESATPAAFERVGDEDAAYLLFTSGTTGDPKGVAVSHANVRSYVTHICERFAFSEQDRLSQHFDMTFDLSVHDMFVGWQSGACVCVVPEKAVMAPAKFIRDQELSCWFSVPSAIGFMQRLRLLKPGAFPSLRCTLFCGEPLPVAGVEAWRAAAPNSLIENLYGPTEATIAITGYRWDDASSPEQAVHGVVPIGSAFPGQRAYVVDEQGRRCARGEDGELWLHGSQVTAGYWNAPEVTARSFVAAPELEPGRWYRTGDRVREDEQGCLVYLGRIDHQVKIRGYRVELAEIEHEMRLAVPGVPLAAIPWPATQGSAEGVVAVLEGSASPDASALEDALKQRCAERLPDYMVPKRICWSEQMPLNANGKLDRRRLGEMLDAGDL